MVKRDSRKLLLKQKYDIRNKKFEEEKGEVLFTCKWHKLAGEEIKFKHTFSEKLIQMGVINYEDVTTCPSCAAERYYGGFEMKPEEKVIKDVI